MDITGVVGGKYEDACRQVPAPLQAGQLSCFQTGLCCAHIVHAAAVHRLTGRDESCPDVHKLLISSELEANMLSRWQLHRAPSLLKS
jgi:hypothetical protein